jgi:hypothetical protein
MRALALALAIAFGAAVTVSAPTPVEAAPKKTKLGCIYGKQKWDASVGKCQEIKKAKPAKKAAKKPAKAKGKAKKKA